MRKITKLIVHCTGTKEGQDYHVADVDRWHRERGFKCIGYHYLITLDGQVERGRKDSEVGAHCKGQNANSIGVCYVGGLDRNGKAKDTRTEAQKDALWDLLFLLHQQYPNSKIYGHRDFAKKDCPCFDATTTYKPISDNWALLYRAGGTIPLRPSEDTE